MICKMDLSGFEPEASAFLFLFPVTGIPNAQKSEDFWHAGNIISERNP